MSFGSSQPRGFFKRIFGGGSSRGSGATDFASFADKAQQGPADCVIVVKEWFALYETLGKVLMSSGMKAQAIVALVNERLIGVCPKCHILYTGQGLAMLSLMHDGAEMINAPPDAYRVLEGHCRNESCSCKKMMIFWKPDEDRNAISRLAGLGIQLRPKVSCSDSVANLDRWKSSGEPEVWVRKHFHGWNHNDWLELLTSLRKSRYWPMDEAAIGQHIEMLRAKLRTVEAPAAYKKCWQCAANQGGDVSSVVEGILDELGGLDFGDFLSLAERKGFTSVSDEGVREEETFKGRKVELQGSGGCMLLFAVPASQPGGVQRFLLDLVVSSQKEPFQIVQLMDGGKRIRKLLKGPPEDSLIIAPATITHYFCAVPPRAIEKYRKTNRGVVEIVQHPIVGGRMWQEVIGIEPKHEQVHIVSLASNTGLNMGTSLESLGVRVDSNGQPSRSVFFRDVHIDDGPDSEAVILGIVFRNKGSKERLFKGTRPARISDI